MFERVAVVEFLLNMNWKRVYWWLYHCRLV